MVEQESESTSSDAVNSAFPATSLSFGNRTSRTQQLFSEQPVNKWPHEELDAVFPLRHHSSASVGNVSTYLSSSVRSCCLWNHWMNLGSGVIQ